MVDGRSRRAARGGLRAGVKSARKAGSSSPVLLGAAGRKSVGSRAGTAKFRDRWRVSVRGSRRKPGIELTLVEGRRPGRDAIVAFDEAARSRVLAAGTLRRARRDMGCQRSNRSPRSRKTTPRRRGAARRLDQLRASRIGVRPQSPDRRAREAHSTEARGAPSSASTDRCLPTLRRPEGGVAAQAASRPASLDSSGARVRVLVAEIGEDHLPHGFWRVARRSRPAR